MTHRVTIKDVLGPARLGPRTAKNALWLAPLTNGQSEPDGLLSEAEARWLLRRAEGGFGVVETCAAFVAQDGKSWHGQLGLDRDDNIDRLRALAGGLRERGALSIAQLFHGGARSPTSVSGCEPFTASAIEAAGGGLEASRAASEDDLLRTIAAFRDAAVRCHAAGFDGVELHGAHSYILNQFLSSTLNRRDDRWGGALENRARLMLEATRAVRAAVPSPFLVGVRLSPENYGNVTGLDLDETAQVAAWLAEAGVDFLHLSLWQHQLNARKYPDQQPWLYIRARVPASTPLVAAGNFWTADEVSSWYQLAAGGADPFIALGRAAILDPDWPKHAAAADFAPRRPPMSPAELLAVDVSPPFIEYLRRWKGFVEG